MSDYGISDTGLARKRYATLLEELNTAVKAVFGDNLNLEPESPDGQINGIISESNANLWELIEAAYNAFNPSVATGAILSNLVQLNGITRQEGTYSTAQLTLYGSNCVIPAGTQFSTSDTGEVFTLDSDVVIPYTSTEATAQVTAAEMGPVSAAAGTITIINTPITGLNSVTNLSDAAEGADEETDVELRVRRAKSVAKAAQAIIDAIYAEIFDVDGVTQLVVLENDTDETDANGLPPHSFHAIVLGGSSAEIASAIWQSKPAGITSYGNTTETITDTQGIEHDINFSRPDEIDIYVDITLTVDEDFPDGGDDLIKQAIVDYANGDLVDGRGFSLGDDVIYTRLYTPINSVTGHEIDALYIGESASPTGTDNIAIDITEMSNFTTDNITITHA